MLNSKKISDYEIVNPFTHNGKSIGLFRHVSTEELVIIKNFDINVQHPQMEKIYSGIKFNIYPSDSRIPIYVGEADMYQVVEDEKKKPSRPKSR